MADGGDDGAVTAGEALDGAGLAPTAGDEVDVLGPGSVHPSAGGNDWFKQLVYAFVDAFKEMPVPPALSMLMVRRFVLEPENDVAVVTYKTAFADAGDGGSAVLKKSRDKLVSACGLSFEIEKLTMGAPGGTAASLPTPTSQDTAMHGLLNGLTMRMQAHFIEKHSSFHTRALDRKTDFDELCKPLLAKFVGSDGPNSVSKTPPTIPQIHAGILAICDAWSKHLMDWVEEWDPTTDAIMTEKVRGTRT